MFLTKKVKGHQKMIKNLLKKIKIIKILTKKKHIIKKEIYD